MDAASLERLGDELYAALRGRTPVAPLRERHPGLDIDGAYRISRRLLERRLADGERVVGKKIGVTSAAVQDALGVHQPDFGWLTDRMACDDGAEMPISTQLIQPRAEGEIAFELSRRLAGPGVTEADVLAATRVVRPCFEIVDSRIRDWKIRIEDTIADNASSGFFVVGKDAVDPRGVDLVGCAMLVHKNGKELSRGTGAATLGSPLAAVAWLANTLGGYGAALEAGEIILSGALVPLEPVRAGDRMSLTIDGIGSASVVFA